jgi:mannose-1-phosphate guanylyltransferase/mannose-6-phosphate isomerase
MCGGSGTRLWPASRPARPKQFIPLAGERSTFQDTVLRISGLEDAADIVVVAGAAHVDAITEQLAELGVSAVLLIEPEPRDSAPAMAAACAWIAAQDPQGIAAVVSADHHVPDDKAFRAALETGARAARDGLIVTLGVTPTSPSTAFGYIAPGEDLGVAARVKAFVEKPDAATAERYIAEGYLWNSGNFVVGAQTLMSELDAYQPEVAKAVREAVAQAPGKSPIMLGEAFRTAPKISIDYAVMEKTKKAAVAPVSFAWSDLGAWDAVWLASEKDDAGNAARGDALFVKAQDCLVRAPEGMQITVIGGKRLAVVADAGQILVCDLDSSQAVKTAVDMLKAQGREAPRPAPQLKDVEEAVSFYDRWLTTAALPLWWSLGADHDRGGFHECLTPDGQPVDHPRRARVQTRQAYVYATAAELGWKGPAKQAAWHGMDYFLTNYRRPDGLFRTLVAPDGAVLDDTAVLYDQAFALMSMAVLHRIDPTRRDLLGEANALRAALDSRRHAAGGFIEVAPDVYQSNAHMHLLEAALAWIEAGGGPEWEALAAEIVELARSKFIDAKGGYLREFFEADWSPAQGDRGRRVEPGHQFEWAWLMARWGKMGRPEATATARKLFENGVAGYDAERQVAIMALFDDLTPMDPVARLWPQTEYIKAAVILGEDSHILTAARALRRYLDTPALGVWRDKLLPDNSFVEEPAPASSLYHIVAACAELRAWAAAR